MELGCKMFVNSFLGAIDLVLSKAGQPCGDVIKETNKEEDKAARLPSSQPQT